MRLWVKDKDNKRAGYVYCEEVKDAVNLITENSSRADPVEEVSLPCDNDTLWFLKQYNGKGHLFRVILRGYPTDEMQLLVLKNHWDKIPLSERTADIIMILKGNHYFKGDGYPKKLVQTAWYRELVALYLSDDCNVPYSYYGKAKHVVDDVVHDAVKNYVATCDNPKAFLFEYFEAKRMFGDKMDDAECWCSALMQQQVADGDTYVNGFTYGNTRPYMPKRPFLP